MDTLLILHQGAIGDFLLALPVIQAAREQLRAEQCVAVASAASARFAAGRSVVTSWISPEDLGIYRLFCRELEPAPRLAELLKETRWILNLLTGPTGCVHDRLSELLSGALISIDPRPTPETREARRHISRQWTADIRAVGWDLADPQYAPIELPRPPSRPAPRVLIHPGSGGFSKCWPLGKFIAVADELKAADVSWMVGPADEDAARELQHRDEPIVYETDLFKAAQHMAAYDLYIGNDAGVTHVAASIGVTTVAIFGTTDPYVWRPLGPHVTVVAPDEVEDSMDCVSVEQVLAAVEASLHARNTI